MPEVSHAPDPVAALEKIGELFHREKEVDMPAGHRVTLAALGAAQEARATARVQDFRAVHFLKAVKVEQLAYSIVEVDGKKFDKPVKKDGAFDEEGYEEQVNTKRHILNSWPEGIVTFLFNELCVLQDEVEEMVGVHVKTEIPSDADMKAADADAGSADGDGDQGSDTE